MSPSLRRLAMVCVILHNAPMKPVEWVGSSNADLKTFPESARSDAGYELFRVQCGLEPGDWKPMPSVGAGVQEIRIRDAAGAFRVIYLATRKEAVYVLHCFQKKSQQTSKRDLQLAKKRYDEVTR